MPLTSAPEAQIDRFTGPYERWVFTEELGRPYTFPAIAHGPSHYHTAVLEGTDQLPKAKGMTTRLPPLWNPLGNTRTITPFCFHLQSPSATDTDTDIATALAGSGSGSGTGVPARYRVNFPIEDAAWVDDYKPCCDMTHWVVPHTRPKAIVAVIDDGLPFANRGYLDSHGRTRISHLWMQSARAKPKDSVPFGRELMNGDINALRARCGDDEARMYRESAATDQRLHEIGLKMLRPATHGGHVMGMAGGNGEMFKGHPIGDDVQIIAVQLPNTISWDMSGFGKEMYMLSALNYIFDRAREISAKFSDDPANPDELPLIVNFSYGWTASRHDGKSAIELAVEEMLTDRKSLQKDTAIILPTGNNFMSDMCAQVTADDMIDGSYRFKWKLLPSDRTSSYLELWFPEGMVVNKYTVSVTPPRGAALSGGEIALSADPALPADGDPRRYSTLKIGDKIVGQLSADKNRNQRWRVMMAVIPTVFTRDQDRAAPSGEWTLTIKRNDGKAMAKAERINIWVHRDDDPNDLNTGGQQSMIVDANPPKYPPRRKFPLQQFDPHLDFVRGYGAMNGVASSPSVVRVAGYVQNTLRPSDYSGSGGLYALANNKAAPWGAQTTLTAVSDQSRTRVGTPSLGVMSGSNTRMIGTSSAAPSVTRLMVLNAVTGRNLMDGMLPAPPIYHTEQTGKAIVQTMHKARVGEHRAPPLTP